MPTWNYIRKLEVENEARARCIDQLIEVVRGNSDPSEVQDLWDIQANILMFLSHFDRIPPRENRDG